MLLVSGHAPVGAYALILPPPPPPPPGARKRPLRGQGSIRLWLVGYYSGPGLHPEQNASQQPGVGQFPPTDMIRLQCAWMTAVPFSQVCSAQSRPRVLGNRLLLLEGPLRL